MSGREVVHHSPHVHYYDDHHRQQQWEENKLRSHNPTHIRANMNTNTNTNGHHHISKSSRSSSRNKNNIVDVGRDVVVNPRQKFNVEFEYEDTIETSSSGSISSGYGRRGHSQHQQIHPPPPPAQTLNQKNQVRYYAGHQQQQPNYNSSRHHQPQQHMMNTGHSGREKIPENLRDEKDGSEIYVMDSAYMKAPPSVYSHYSGKSRAPSEMSSVKTKTSRKGGVVVETMSAPNPLCPGTKGVCCLLVLINLGLILICLGFSIVLQLTDPPFVMYFGVAFLIVGFIALIASLIFCLHLCRESEAHRRRGLNPSELYWTHHWQKRINLPGMTREVEKDDDTVYSQSASRNEPEDKYYTRDESQHRNMTPIHTYNHH